jgi:predicted RNA binding protein YcfA (HicA-like mRNA interferase family)
VSKLPRDVSGEQLATALARLGYREVRQTGSHIRMKGGRGGEEPVTVPRHKSLKVGTLSGILDDVCIQIGMTREQLLEALDL